MTKGRFSDITQALRYQLCLPWYRSRLYPLRLSAPAPSQLYVVPSVLTYGDAQKGQRFFAQQFEFEGEKVILSPQQLDKLSQSRQWQAQFHSFSWLQDLRAYLQEVSEEDVGEANRIRRMVRHLFGYWMEIGGDLGSDFGVVAIRPDVLGTRLFSLLMNFQQFFGSAEPAYQRRILREVSFEAAHLHRVLPASLKGVALIEGITGLLSAAFCLADQPQAEAWRKRGIELLEQALNTQIDSAGQHCQRSLAVNWKLIILLYHLRGLLNDVQHPPLRFLDNALKTLTVHMRLMIHDDGCFAHFNVLPQVPVKTVRRVLERIDLSKVPALEDKDPSLQYVKAKRSVLLVDAASFPDPGLNQFVHAGTFSFEYAIGRQRIVVNCGSQSGTREWRGAQKVTAAQSTLVIDNKNSSEIHPNGGVGRRASVVDFRRHDLSEETVLDMTHDGYFRKFGIYHHRRFALSHDGKELHGVDRLVRDEQSAFSIKKAHVGVLRFHLHPSLRATVTQNEQGALLLDSKNKGVRFAIEGAKVRVEESIFLTEDETQGSQQLVAEFEFEGKETQVSWRFYQDD